MSLAAYDVPVCLDHSAVSLHTGRSDGIMNASPQAAASLDKMMAQACVLCPVCRQARKKQRGIAFKMVQTVETRLCPFCRAYERVYGRKAHEPVAP
jgi:hypothetical protein